MAAQERDRQLRRNCLRESPDTRCRGIVILPLPDGTCTVCPEGKALAGISTAGYPRQTLMYASYSEVGR